MSTLKRWMLFGFASVALTLAPVNIFGASSSATLATVECFDCRSKVDYCCGNCIDPMQGDKCTCGEPWCAC